MVYTGVKYSVGIKRALASWYSSRFSVFAESIIIGIATGAVVVLLRISLDYAAGIRGDLYEWLSVQSWLHVSLWILVLVPAGLLLGYASKNWPMIDGSGIPQIRGALTRKMHLSWWPELPLKFLSTVMGIGLGLSIGREGPSIQMGAYTGKAYLSLLRRPAVERQILITSGAAAGLAAAFNAPLAGVLFVLEELHKHFSALLIACAMGASLAGYLIVSSVFGLQPVFSFVDMGRLPLRHIWAVVLLGAAAAFTGHLFKLAMYAAQDAYRILRVPRLVRPVLPLLLTVPIGLFAIDLIGGGHHLIQVIADMRVTVAVLALMLLVKIVFSALSYGSGTSGGIFLPLLACGALLGKIWGVSLESLGLIENSMHLNFVILGMAAFFTSVVKTPITGAVLILEMSGNFSHFSGLVACCLTAFVVSDLLRSRSIYDVFLERMLSENPAEYAPVNGHKSVIEIPIGIASSLAESAVQDVDWPKGILIVGIERGEGEIIPNGQTVIQPGDRLLVMVPEEIVTDVKGDLLALGTAGV